MSQLDIGIIGLPNVGKSTLFQALTAIAVPAENYPFCTIEPNVGVVEVPDERLVHLYELVEPRRPKRIHAVVGFSDIAGLVAGASKGEGLGNQFLGHIRQVDAVVHVVRCFEDGSVIHPYETPDPARDRDVVEIELALADLEVVEGRIGRIAKKAQSGEKEARGELALMERLRDRLRRGEPARREPLEPQERDTLRGFGLLTLKPVLYIANIGEDCLVRDHPLVDRLRSSVAAEGHPAEVLPLCARLEAELAQLPAGERGEFLQAMGLEESGLDRLVRAGYRLLELITFFTIGDEEVRAWTVRRGASAAEAAGCVHSDFQERFIRAETIHYGDFLEFRSMKQAREHGRIRAEGREYVVQDGDILYFRINP
jgi:GTP-binding protein YchF